MDTNNTTNNPMDKCPVCDKKIADILSGKVTCQPCYEAVENIIAQRSVLRHMLEAFLDFFDFRFLSCISSLKWAQERLCSSGDYEPGKGYFYKKGYLKIRK